MRTCMIIIASAIILYSTTVYATPNEQSEKIERIEKELIQLKAQFMEMQKLYEVKIAHLEEKVQAQQTASLPYGYRPNKTSQKESTYSAAASYLNPDISVIVDVKQRFNDDVGDDNRDKLTVGEAELKLGGFIFPGIRGDATVAVENEYSGESDVSSEVDLEEAYISFLELPLNSQIQVGRKLIDFGVLNSQHPHSWAFTDTPLILENLFGHHPWYDDGVQISTLIPNPADIYWEAKFGVWNGRIPGHSHDHSDDESTSSRRFNLENQTVQFDDHVYTARTYINIPFQDNIDVGLGYSAAWDEHPTSTLHGIDLTMRYRFPNKNSWLKWQTEYIFAKLDAPEHHHDDDEEEHHSPADITPHGFYSMLEYAFNQHWRIGTRFDYAEYNENDAFYQWAASTFVTYHFNHNLYIRGTYRYRDFSDFSDMHQEPENTIWLQIVWGLGPHTHGVAE